MNREYSLGLFGENPSSQGNNQIVISLNVDNVTDTIACLLCVEKRIN